jgi:hypothetical protein
VEALSLCLCACKSVKCWGQTARIVAVLDDEVKDACTNDSSIGMIGLICHVKAICAVPHHKCMGSPPQPTDQGCPFQAMTEHIIPYITTKEPRY